MAQKPDDPSRVSISTDASGIQANKALGFHDALRQELTLIDEKRRRRGDPTPDSTNGARHRESEDRDTSKAEEEALARHLFGLAFSGGGIRSATFNLGVLQGLAEQNLLRHVDYLSTVSGGGYIGSWLSAWLHRLKKEQNVLSPVKKVEECLNAEEDAKHPITFLRRFSNYLTPKVGFLSADTWTVGTIYLRNTLLNLVMLVAAFAVVLLIPRLIHPAIYHPSTGSLWPAITVGLGAVLGVVAMIFIGRDLGSSTSSSSTRACLNQDRVQLLIVLPLLVIAGLVTNRSDFDASDLAMWQLIAFGTATYLLAWTVAAVSSWVHRRAHAGQGDGQGGGQGGGQDGGQDEAREEKRTKSLSFTNVLLASLPTGVVFSLLLSLAFDLLAEASAWARLTWGPGLFLLALTLSAALHIGLLGRKFHDHEREWLARVAAWLLIYGFAWTALSAAVVYGPPILLRANGWVQAALASGWIGSTLAGLFAGRSQAERGEGDGIGRALIVRFAPWVFIVGLILSLALGISAALKFIHDDAWESFAGSEELAILVKNHFTLLDTQGDPLWLVGIATGLCLILLAMSLRIDINEFSMHGFYRNRLVRAYLGATVKPETREEHKHPFTALHRDDDIPLADLETHDGPYHLVNTTLNLVGGKELAWQERKAASFLMSPRFCGFATPTTPEGYRRTAGFGSDPNELTLGSAFAISGAAASPNMGYHSSPALAFLLTVFNVRLGWWLGNPAGSAWQRSSPMLALRHLINELLGRTGENKKYVYVSDGGHFENLGIYELVRRRCRFIIAGDAGADPDLAFEDLGNAIRKCRVDLGIDIKIDVASILRDKKTGLSDWHCAVGEICYSEMETGTLLYLKATVTGDEPADVRNYLAKNPEFPHQSTADQFFNESQFESYRALGCHIVKSALGEPAEGYDEERGLNLGRLVRKVRQRWYPPSRGAESFTRHTSTLDQMFERARTSPDLTFLDRQLYPEWDEIFSGPPSDTNLSDLPKDEKVFHQCFYFCKSLIQLMENVYMDLYLEEEHDHPDNRGWMNLFRHWAWSPMFQATWAVAACTYGIRFQNFCKKRLGLSTCDQIEAVEIKKTAVAESSDLNSFERDILLAFLEENQDVDQIFALKVVINKDGGSTSEFLRFPCGFAVTRGSRLVLFKIQDHLRKMGLGRMALKRLLDDGKIKEAPKLGQIPKPYRDEFSKENEARLRRLFRSVEVESHPVRR